MARFRKKPVVIDAVRYLPATIIPVEWAAEAARNGVITFNGVNALIHTMEGVMTASPGDWIIRGVQGELYPCKPDIFDMTYEPVDEN